MSETHEQHLIAWALTLIANVDAPQANWPEQTPEWCEAAQKWINEAAPAAGGAA